MDSDRTNAIEFSLNSWTGNGEIYASFTPEFWEEVGYLQGTANNKDQFIQSFKNKIVGHVWMDYRLEERRWDDDYDKSTASGIARNIWDNWVNINNVWQESIKRKMIRIEIKTKMKFSISFLRSQIREDSKDLENKYLDKLERDFPDWNKEIIINLGNIMMTYDDSIVKETLRKKYPNFDVNQISIVDNENFSHFCKCFKFKIRINGNSQDYSHGDLKPTFSQIINSNFSSQGQNGYVSKSGYTLEELRNQRYNFDFKQAQINYQRNQNLNDYTKANQRFVQAQNDYILHIQQGQPLISSTNQQITLRPQPKKFTYEELYNWKRQEKEIIKSYIRDWSNKV